MYGSQTFKTMSSRVTTHSFEPGDDIKLSKFLSKTMSPVRGTSAKLPAKQGSTEHGYWYRQSYLYQEGQILGFRLYGTINGGCRANSMILVRLRADASFIQINAQLHSAAGAAYQEIPVFTGRADILSPAEAVEYGVKISRTMRSNLMDREELEEDFEINVIAQGTDKPVIEEVKTSSGETRKVAVPKQPGRRIRIRH